MGAYGLDGVADVIVPLEQYALDLRLPLPPERIGLQTNGALGIGLYVPVRPGATGQVIVEGIVLHHREHHGVERHQAGVLRGDRQSIDVSRRSVHVFDHLEALIVGVFLSCLHQRLIAAHHVVGGQLVAVVKLYAAAQVEYPVLAVLDPVVGQHRHRLLILVQVHHAFEHQLVDADHAPYSRGDGAVRHVTGLHVADGDIRIGHVHLGQRLLLLNVGVGRLKAPAQV